MHRAVIAVSPRSISILVMLFILFFITFLVITFDKICFCAPARTERCAGEIMARSLVSAGRAMTPSRWQRLPRDHLAEQDETGVVQINFAIQVRGQDLILGPEWICGQVAAVQ